MARLAGRAAVAVVGAGVVAGKIPGDAESPRMTAAPTRTPEGTRGPGVDLPTAEPLAPHRFVVPRGRDDATQLDLASVSGVVPPRTLRGLSQAAIPGQSSQQIGERSSTSTMSQAISDYGRRRQRRPCIDEVTTQGAADRSRGCRGLPRTSRSWLSSVGRRPAGQTLGDQT